MKYKITKNSKESRILHDAKIAARKPFLLFEALPEEEKKKTKDFWKRFKEANKK